MNILEISQEKMLLAKLVERNTTIEELYYGNQKLELGLKKAQEDHASEKKSLMDVLRDKEAEIGKLKAEIVRLTQKKA